MNEKGRYADNVFVERLWRTVKYEKIYLNAYSNGPEAKAGIGAYFYIYNTQRPRQAPDYRTRRRYSMEPRCHQMTSQ